MSLRIVVDGTRYRVATMHAPGPSFMSKDKWLLSYAAALLRENVDIVAGDFNMRENFTDVNWLDVSHTALAHGTTLRVKQAAFGRSRWDKILVCKRSPLLAAATSALVDVIAPEHRAISDHAGVRIVFRPNRSSNCAIFLTAALAIAFFAAVIWLVTRPAQRT